MLDLTPFDFKFHFHQSALSSDSDNISMMASFNNFSKKQNVTYDFPSQLDRLPMELMTLVASHLDFSSTLSLASALPCLHSLLLESPLQWQLLMSKVPWNTKSCPTSCDLSKCTTTNMQLVEDTLAFILPNSLHHLFNDLLISICSNFKPKEEEGDWLEVELPTKIPSSFHLPSKISSISPLQVSPHGFLLLATADSTRRKISSETDQASFQLLNASLQHPPPSLLSQLALTVSSQKSEVASLELELVSLHNEEDAEWAGKLLQNCQSWRVEELELLGQVNLSL